MKCEKTHFNILVHEVSKNFVTLWQRWACPKQEMMTMSSQLLWPEEPPTYKNNLIFSPNNLNYKGLWNRPANYCRRLRKALLGTLLLISSRSLRLLRFKHKRLGVLLDLLGRTLVPVFPWGRLCLVTFVIKTVWVCGVYKHPTVEKYFSPLGL